MLAAQVVLFGVALWMGLYLIRRELRGLRLRLAALSLLLCPPNLLTFGRCPVMLAAAVDVMSWRPGSGPTRPEQQDFDN